MVPFLSYFVPSRFTAFDLDHNPYTTKDKKNTKKIDIRMLESSFGCINPWISMAFSGCRNNIFIEISDYKICHIAETPLN